MKENIKSKDELMRLASEKEQLAKEMQDAGDRHAARAFSMQAQSYRDEAANIK